MDEHQNDIGQFDLFAYIQLYCIFRCNQIIYILGWARQVCDKSKIRTYLQSYPRVFELLV